MHGATAVRYPLALVLLAAALPLLAACDPAASAPTGDASADVAAVDVARADAPPADAAAGEDARPAASDTAPAPDTTPPPDVPGFPPSPPSDDVLDRTDYLLVTTPALAAAFEALAEWKRAQGYAVEIVTTADVDAAVAEGDAPARLRSYLRRRHTASPLRYVLLGGDHPALPRREVHATEDVVSEGQYFDDIVASDLYYADLQGDWDGDGDGIMAEREDGLDLLPDFAVGRLPFASPAEVTAYVARLRDYETARHDDYQDRALFLAEWAGSTGGGEVYSSGAFELALRPLVPETVRLTRLYGDADRWPGAEDNTAAAQRAAFAEGHALAVDFGHGMHETLCNLEGAEILGLPDTGRPLVYWTTECYAGMFDWDEGPCGAELFLKAPGGGVAYVGNSDLGAGFPSLTALYTNMLGRLYDGRASRIGDLVVEGLRTYSSPATLATRDHPDRWTNIVLVLLGDPTLRLWTRPPVRPQLAGTADETGVRIVVTGPDGAPLPGLTVAAYRTGERLHRTETDAEGRAALGFAVPASGPYDITVSGSDVPVTTWRSDAL